MSNTPGGHRTIQEINPMPLKEGDTAPAFSTIDQDGRKVTLKDLLRKGRLILYFYPKDDTPGCTTEACDFQDRWSEIEAKGANVVGVSPDGQESHRKFREKFSLGFPLLVDSDHAIAEAYGAWGEKKNYGKTYEGLIRSTVVVDPEGKIVLAQYNVRATGHV